MPLDFATLKQIGEFSNSFLNRRTIPSVKNPMDKCTIVSIFPKPIDEVKPTIQPGYFHIDAGSYENPSILVVGSSSWWKDIDIEQPLLEIPVSSIKIAESVVTDYCKGMLGCDMVDSMPGFFFVMGECNTLEIKTKYKNSLDTAKKKQDKWYEILVKIADSLWARTNGNPLTISEDMRVAAESLGFKDKPWIKDFTMINELTRCIACGNMRNVLYPVCPTCKAIDHNHPAAANLKFAV